MPCGSSTGVKFPSRSRRKLCKANPATYCPVMVPLSLIPEALVHPGHGDGGVPGDVKRADRSIRLAHKAMLPFRIDEPARDSKGVVDGS